MHLPRCPGAGVALESLWGRACRASVRSRKHSDGRFSAMERSRHAVSLPGHVRHDGPERRPRSHYRTIKTKPRRGARHTPERRVLLEICHCQKVAMANRAARSIGVSVDRIARGLGPGAAAWHVSASGRNLTLDSKVGRRMMDSMPADGGHSPSGPTDLVARVPGVLPLAGASDGHAGGERLTAIRRVRCRPDRSPCWMHAERENRR